MNSRIGDLGFPTREMIILFLEAAERTPLERIVLGVFHARFHFALMPRHVGLIRQDR